jgi:hypothetical protein
MSGGGGGVYLGGDFDIGEKELRWPDREIAGGGGTVGETVRRRKKERKEEEEIFDRTVISPKGVNLGGVLLCPKDVSEGGTLSSTVARSRYYVRTLGHH